MSSVAETSSKVQRILTDFLGRVEVDQDGDFTFRHGSTRVFIGVREGFGGTIVTVTAPVLFKVPPSAELFEHLATENDYVFGSFRARRTEDGVSVLFQHSVLGDFLDPEELKAAVGAVVSTADTVDDPLQERFGGDRFHED